MPVCRIRTSWVYFAHVPKCAGSAVERYLADRFGPLGLHDPLFRTRDPAAAWTQSPPQHMPEPVRADLLPDTLFDAVFATVRHPADRLVSLFLYQRDLLGSLPGHLAFDRWLDTLPRTLATAPYALYGHLRPMAEYVPDGAIVFRVEDGLDRLVPWLDTLAGDTGGARTLPRVNVLADRRAEARGPDPAPGPATLARIAEIYAADYARFDYPEDPAALEAPA